MEQNEIDTALLVIDIASNDALSGEYGLPKFSTDEESVGCDLLIVFRQQVPDGVL